MEKILVKATPYFREDESVPDDDRFVWSFNIEIANAGKKAIKLTNRDWVLVNQNGIVHHSESSENKGEEPILNPGESFEYSSGAHLNTPSGMMFGKCHAKDETGEEFEIDIPPFSLDSPHAVRVLN